MLYLNKDAYSKYPCSYPFSAPIFSHNQNCHIWWKQAKILRGDKEWQSLEEHSGDQSIFIEADSADIKILKVRKLIKL